MGRWEQPSRCRLFALIAALQALQRGSAVGVRRFDVVGLQLSARWRPASAPGGWDAPVFPDSVLAAAVGTLLERHVRRSWLARLRLRDSWGFPRPFSKVVPMVPVVVAPRRISRPGADRATWSSRGSRQSRPIPCWSVASVLR